MTLWTILIIVLLFALIGVFPSWNYSSSWGFGPSSIIGTILIIIVILLLLGKL